MYEFQKSQTNEKLQVFTDDLKLSKFAIRIWNCCWVLSIENGHKQVYISRMHMFEVLKMIITDLLFITKSNCNEKWLQIRFWCSPSNIMYWFIWIVYESYEKILLLFVIIHLLWIYNFIVSVIHNKYHSWLMFWMLNLGKL